MLLSALRGWARDSPTTAASGIARSIIRFSANVVPVPDHPDTADTLEAMRSERLGLAHAAPTRIHTTVGADAIGAAGGAGVGLRQRKQVKGLT